MWDINHISHNLTSVLITIFFLKGSPIHQKLMPEQSLRHPLSECSSPVHQFYQSLPEAVTIQDLQKFSSSRDSTMGLPPENFSVHNFPSYDSTNRSTSYSPIHSQYGNNPNSSSPIKTALFNQVPNLGLYSGNNSPILNPLMSPSTSPVFGGYSQTTPSTSVSSITQGKWLLTGCYQFGEF